MKVGSVIVREYQGKLHEVLVVPGGFCWQDQVYVLRQERSFADERRIADFDPTGTFHGLH